MRCWQLRKEPDLHAHNTHMSAVLKYISASRNTSWFEQNRRGSQNDIGLILTGARAPIEKRATLCNHLQCTPPARHMSAQTMLNARSKNLTNRSGGLPGEVENQKRDLKNGHAMQRAHTCTLYTQSGTSNALQTSTKTLTQHVDAVFFGLGV